MHGLGNKENGKGKEDECVNVPVVTSAEHDQAAAAVSFDLAPGGAGELSTANDHQDNASVANYVTRDSEKPSANSTSYEDAAK